MRTEPAGKYDAVREVRIGTSGWTYPEWRGPIYPKGLVQRRELGYLAARFNTVEINGSFYSLRTPSSYQTWRAQVPSDFVFAVKGGRFLTHTKRLRDIEQPLANFLGSGVLALGEALGPILWQFPATLRFHPDVVASFFATLPATTGQAAQLAALADERLKQAPFTAVEADRPLRYAVEPRHASFDCPEFFDLCRRHRIAVVLSDSPRSWPKIDCRTTDFGYVRLHGGKQLYASSYTREDLAGWHRQMAEWRQRGEVDSLYVYFDNTMAGHAFRNARALVKLFESG